MDYMLNYTKNDQIIYFGHSQGTTESFILLSEKPEYNDKIKTVFNLAPSAFFRHVAAPYYIPTKFRKNIEVCFNICFCLFYMRIHLLMSFLLENFCYN